MLFIRYLFPEKGLLFAHPTCVDNLFANSAKIAKKGLRGEGGMGAGPLFFDAKGLKMV